MRSVVSALIISTAAANLGKYKSGEVHSYENFTYGRFTTRMQGPNKHGTCQAFFTMYRGDDRT